MTNEQINTAIAEACGITQPDQHGTLYRTKNVWQYNCPDYCNDLNAMHEAEKLFNSWDNYVNYQSWLGYCGGNAIVQLQQCITATARQRAEAFLRTLGKWEEVQG